jgi:hypothetical protein
VLDGLEKYFQVVEPSAMLMSLLIYELNLSEGKCDRNAEMDDNILRMCSK